MRYLYPVKLIRDEGQVYIASCRDVPEAVTDGSTPENTISAMSDALGAALAGYSLEKRDIPIPSKIQKNEQLVPVSALVATKLALRAAMAEKNISNVSLAERLGISEGAVRRLVDPDHASKLEGVIRALNILGHRIIVEDMEADQLAVT